MSVPEPCPCEDTPPASAPGRVGDDECLVRFISDRHHVGRDDEGNYFIVSAGVPKDDLRQYNDWSFSTVRESHIDKGEMIIRAVAVTKTQEWKADPVLGRSTATALRSVRDKAQRREVCVNADPTTSENDKLGPCAAHASIVRSTPPLDENDRLAWLTLRTKVGECFDHIRHNSGAIPVIGRWAFASGRSLRSLAGVRRPSHGTLDEERRRTTRGVPWRKARRSQYPL
jgi:hypothetical protein